MQHTNIYLDQNIIGHVRDGTLDLAKVPGVIWLYSNEHFREIGRSDDRSFLDALKKINAQHIEIILDDEFRITDRMQIDSCTSPHERFDMFLEAAGDCEVDEGLFITPYARLSGADNYPELETIPERFLDEIQALLEPIGKWDETTRGNVLEVADSMADLISSELSETRSLETLRKPLGIDKGKIGNPKTDNPLMEIWEKLSPMAGGLSADQFFGFEPIDKQGYAIWPMYLGIVGCYSILNFIGYRPDKKIASQKAIENTISDAAHVAHAAFCDVLLSEDRRLCAKAGAIYKFKKIGTHVPQVEINKIK